MRLPRGLVLAMVSATMSSVRKLHAAVIFFPTVLIWASVAASTAQADTATSEGQGAEPSIVRARERGFHLTLAPGVYFPSNGGKTAFSLGIHGRYGIDLESVIVAPGAMFTSYFGDTNVYLGAVTTRLTFPLGPFGPYVEGGLGVGSVNQPSQTGLLLMGGAGFMLYLGERAGLGLGLEYLKITGTNFAGLSLGPSILLAF